MAHTPERPANLRECGWRQAALIESCAAPGLLTNNVDRQVKVPTDGWLIVLSQDCDIVRSADVEPFVEFIAAGPVSQPNAQLKNGQSARFLHLPIVTGTNEIWVECSVHDRFRIPKSSLHSVAPSEAAHVTDEAARLLRQWIARRYTRRPFPDEFERRLQSTSGPIKTLLKSDAAKLVTGIYIATSEAELGHGEDYVIEVIATVTAATLSDNDNADLLDQWEQRFITAIKNRPGIRFAGEEESRERIEIMREEDVTIGDLRRFKRFDVDYRSDIYNDEVERPPEGLDQE